MLLVGAGVALAVVAARHRRSDTAVGLAPFDGWSLRGARHVEYGDGGIPILSVAVDEARLERLRLGMFRLGFAHRLDARNLTITIALPVTTDREALRRLPDLRRSLTSLGMSPSRRAGLTSVRVQGLTLHVDGGAREWLEVIAQRCDVGLPRPTRLELRNGVRIRSADIERTFVALSYDVAARRFVGGRIATPAGNTPLADPTLQNALAEVNAVLARLLPRSRQRGESAANAPE